VSRRELMVLNPKVCTTVGKKFVTEPDATIQKSISIYLGSVHVCLA